MEAIINGKYRARVAKTIVERAIGLMFSREKKNILFVFDREGYHPIHSFFVPFSFDAIYLNKDWKVVDVISDIKPFSVYICNKKPAKYLIELTENHDIGVGQHVSCRFGMEDND